MFCGMDDGFYDEVIVGGDAGKERSRN
jgi:hypothetical protein